MLRNSEIDQFRIDGLSEELFKRGLNANKMKNQELFDTLLTYFKYKVPSVTAEETNRKAFSDFLNT